MKLKLNKNIRLGLTVIVIITIIIFSYLIYSEAYNPGFEENTSPVYSYDSKGSIKYAVYLKPNNLYTHNRLEEGQLYITEFIDYIDTNIKYEFIGEREAEIKGNYNIIAKVKGFTGEEENIINVWEKDFFIIQYKQINTNTGKVSIIENLKLNLNEYNTFVKEIKEATKINCQTALILSMNINIKGTTDKGPIEVFSSPDLVIPLEVTMFEISGNNIIDQPGAIEETVQERLPLNKNQLISYGTILFILIIALIFLIFFTIIAPKKNLIEKEIKRIFKKHGDRLVALNSDIDVKKAIIVKSIEDLVKLSDDIEKPILYRYRADYKEINKFYVIHEDNNFVFDFKYLKVFKQIEETENKETNSTNEDTENKEIYNTNEDTENKEIYNTNENLNEN
jgi:hypothetical protein